ncbi:atherin-like [Vulpes lagopus]|uniref:atherin-like n=1 Tax=Vulpes lagopus TaxID=494514 RepID=UPI001BCA5AC5|nr:atherin-like [Vulpes lagopus]
MPVLRRNDIRERQGRQVEVTLERSVELKRGDAISDTKATTPLLQGGTAPDRQPSARVHARGDVKHPGLHPRPRPCPAGAETSAQPRALAAPPPPPLPGGPCGGRGPASQNPLRASRERGRGGVKSARSVPAVGARPRPRPLRRGPRFLPRTAPELRALPAQTAPAHPSARDPAKDAPPPRRAKSAARGPRGMRRPQLRASAWPGARRARPARRGPRPPTRHVQHTHWRKCS